MDLILLIILLATGVDLTPTTGATEPTADCEGDGVRKQPIG
ncbi:MAG: hypothetical protein U0529_05790 [Thermoanaerobaculia bacterium]